MGARGVMEGKGGGGRGGHSRLSRSTPLRREVDGDKRRAALGDCVQEGRDEYLLDFTELLVRDSLS